MTRIFTVELADTENVKNFRSRIICTNKVNRIRLIEKRLKS